MRKSLLLIGICLAAALAAACSNADFEPMAPDNDFYSESGVNRVMDVTIMATVKKDQDGKVYLWSKGKRINPNEAVAFTREMRVMSEMTIFPGGESQDYKADIHWIEPIEEGVFTGDAKVSGTDGVDVMPDSWMTCLDDAYLTLYYSAWWGEHPVHHDFYLVSGTDPQDPYSLELRHNAHGDGTYSKEEGLICFDINSLPPTGDASKTLSLKWHDTKGNIVTAKFEFKSRK
ncbi:MAG: hypothetical protein IKX67_08210 [Bacteroidales bacterium]|nr:hypothetical protein [Bacteroidales bacterium]